MSFFVSVARANPLPRRLAIGQFKIQITTSALDARRRGRIVALNEPGDSSAASLK